MRCVIYTRASTKEQRQSGLGFAAQLKTCRSFADLHGIRVLAEYSETGSGKLPVKLRPVLLEAIEQARAQGACVLVAKPDRLTRDVETIGGLLKLPAPSFVSAEDGLAAPTLQLHLKIVLAHQERAMIAQRTRDALQALKARGEVLGHANHTDREAIKRARALGGAATRERAEDYARRMAPILRQFKGQRLEDIASALCAGEVLLPRGGSNWTRCAVSRLITKIKELGEWDN